MSRLWLLLCTLQWSPTHRHSAAAAVVNTRLIFQDATELQPQLNGQPCSDVTATGCRGGYAAAAAWMRWFARYDNCSNCLVAMGTDSFSQLVLTHPSAYTLNAEAHERLQAAFAVAPPRVFAARAQRTQASLQDYLRRARAGARVVSTNVKFESDTYMPYYDLMDRSYIQNVTWPTGGSTLVGYLWLWGEDTKLPLQLRVQAAYYAAKRLRLQEVSTVVALLDEDSVLSGCTSDCAERVLGSAGGSADFEKPLDVVVLPAGANGSSRTPWLRVDPKHKDLGTWFVPRGEPRRPEPHDFAGIVSLDLPLSSTGRLAAAPTVKVQPTDLPPPTTHPGYAEDAAWLQKLVDEAAVARVTYGQSTAPMPSGSDCRMRECALGALFAKASLLAAVRADVAMLEGGHFRDGWPQGPIKAQALYAAVASQQTLCALETRATTIKYHLEKALADCSPAGGCDSFPQVAGMDVEYNLALPPWSRVTKLRLPPADGPDPTNYRRRNYTLIMFAHQCTGAASDGYVAQSTPLRLGDTPQSAAAELLLQGGQYVPHTPGLTRASTSQEPLDFERLTAANCTTREYFVTGWEECVPCLAGFWNPNGLSVAEGAVACEAIPEPDHTALMIVLIVLSIVCGCGAAVFAIFWYRRRVQGSGELIRQRSEGERLKNDNEVAADLAQAISAMRLEEVSYIKNEEKYKSELQVAFREIVNMLETFRTYLPTSLTHHMLTNDESDGQSDGHWDDSQSRGRGGSKPPADRSQRRPGRHQIERLRDMELWQKLGTMMRVETEPCWLTGPALGHTSGETTANVAHFLSTVLEAGTEEEGIALSVTADAVLIAWNTHRPRPDHAYAACRFATAVRQTLSGADLVWWGAGGATGALHCGHSGTADHRCPVAVGGPVALSHNVAQLGRRVGAELLIAESVYEYVQSMANVHARVVDCVTEQQRSGVVGGFSIAAAFSVSMCSGGAIDDAHAAENLLKRGSAMWRSRPGCGRDVAIVLAAHPPQSINRLAIGGSPDSDCVRTGLIWCFASAADMPSDPSWMDSFNGWDGAQFEEYDKNAPGALRGAVFFDFFEVSEKGKSAVVRIPQGARVSHVALKLLTAHSETADTISATSVHFFREERTVLVYELLDKPFRDEHGDYVRGFLELRALNIPEARQRLAAHLRRCNGDAQAARLLRLCLLKQDTQGGDDEGYVRPYYGWEDLEGQAETRVRVPGELRGHKAEELWWKTASPDGGRTQPSSPAAGGAGEALRSLIRNVYDGNTHRASESADGAAGADPLGAQLPSSSTLAATHAAATADRLGRTVVTISPRSGTKHTWHRSDQKLGAGTFGQVWLGMGDDGGLVAFKTVKLPSTLGAPGDETAEQEKALNGLVREVSVLAELRHINIVSYIGSALSGDYVVIVMEFLSGGSLEGLLAQFGRLQVGAVQRYIRDILRGLHFLHSREPTPIVHRDLKPGNVMFTIEGLCKLVDFGTAGELSRRIGNSQGMVGTPLYISPEATLTLGGPPCDIWSVGVMFCQILTGRFPYDFQESEFHPFRFMIRLGTQAEAMTLVPTVGVPPDAVAFMRACLKVNPADRPTTKQLLVTPFLVSAQPEYDVDAALGASAREAEAAARRDSNPPLAAAAGAAEQPPAAAQGSEEQLQDGVDWSEQFACCDSESD